MKRMSSSSAAVQMSPRPRAGSVAPSHQPVAPRPAPGSPRDRSVPWLLRLIVICALVLAGVLLVVLARLATLPAVSPSSTPGPAPLSRSQNPGPDESETQDWAGRPDPGYQR
jgi:hypothetical protein